MKFWHLYNLAYVPTELLMRILRARAASQHGGEMLLGRVQGIKSCKNTTQEFTTYVWDEKARKRGEDKPVKQQDHCMDMVRYGLFTHFFREYPGKLMGFNYD